MKRILISWAVLGFLGCGGSEMYTVSGTVTWNGTAIPDGYIIFEPVDGKTQGASGKIVAGKFEFPSKAGAMRVQVHASREGKIDPVMKSPTHEAYIPERYNSQTILKAEVTPNGPNTFTFPLTDKP